jgi:hypothetical protein
MVLSRYLPRHTVKKQQKQLVTTVSVMLQFQLTPPEYKSEVSMVQPTYSVR